MFEGQLTALITPFKKNRVDDAAFQKLVEWQIKEGIHGLVPCGTTGESPTLSIQEHQRVVELCVETADGRVPVIAGAGSNSTEKTIALSLLAKKAGADAVLLAAPYYNKPTQEGLYRHYKAVHDAVAIPILLYNIPGRSVVNIADDTMARLAKLPRIIGVKDATGDLARVSTLRAKAGKDFLQLSGEDMTMVPFNAAGGKGCISVTSNILPRACAEVQKATLTGDFSRALALHDKLVDIHSAMFCETSPGPVKYALHLMGKCRPDMRLPLAEISDESKARVKNSLKNARLI